MPAASERGIGGPPRWGKARRIQKKIFVKKDLPFRTNCANIIKLSDERAHALLAQLDRASGYGPEGQGFESLTACQKAGHPFGCPAFCMFTGIRTGAGVNEAPVAPQSRGLASAAAEVESLTACQKAGHPFGCPAFCMFTGIRTGAGVNEAPVAPQSRDLASATAEVESLTACRVVADCVSFATAFSFSKQTPSLIHSVAPPFKIKTARALHASPTASALRCAGFCFCTG